ncbi:hypothetical protein FHL15_009296 [Xylaria flabelliformis]|uniref:Tse2 ADP-ribosyltransferase toxin domain-containing protein n=1 Tax=Xylaria flabelliformis TaxID=2512241 RepID=A0A553HPI2_9PEZI|nr:hypothetical protein FHL15_009296 [Xylaria flabelliformis]
MSSLGMIKVFRSFPRELFRVNNGRQVKLRVQQPGRHLYDILAKNGQVEPKALHPSTYIAPNGASMRPNSPYQQSLVSTRFRGTDVIVFAVAKGTDLPEDLLLVHERSDHYSLQPSATMTIDDLNWKITKFMEKKAQVYTREQWMETYPEATEESNFYGFEPRSQNIWDFNTTLMQSQRPFTSKVAHLS